MAGPAFAQPRKLARQRPCQADPISDPGEQTAARMRHQTGSVRRNFYLHQTPIACHLQGDPPESELQASRTRRIPAQADSPAAPVPGAATAWCTIRANRIEQPSTIRGEPHFPSKRESETFLKRQGVSVLDGAHVDPRRGERPFSEIADAWRDTWTDLEPKTRVGYESILNRHLLPRFGNAKVAAISAEAVQKYVNELAADRAPNTVRRIFGVLRGVLGVAVSRRYIALNPCDAVKLPSKRGATKRPNLYLTPPEVRALAESIDAHYRVAVYVSAWCGLRAGELWTLRRDDVNLTTGTLRVDEAIKEVTAASSVGLDSARRLTDSLVIGVPKSEASNRTIKLPTPIRAMLAEHLSRPLPGGNGPEAFIFTTPNGRPVRHNLFYKRVFRPAVKASLPERLQRLRWHDLRHTCASLSLAVAPNLYVVMNRLGHDDIKTTVNTYGHLLPSVDDALADGLAELFESSFTSNVTGLRQLRNNSAETPFSATITSGATG